LGKQWLFLTRGAPLHRCKIDSVQNDRLDSTPGTQDFWSQL
jgi:hypothetical protein